MSWRIFRRVLATSRVRLLVVALASFGWGLLMPVVYTNFSPALRDLVNSGAIPRNLMSFGSGDLFSLSGALTLGMQHPMVLAFLGIFAVGSTAAAVAGERERGTLEVLLSRPISRRTHYATVGAATLVLIGIVLAALVAGQLTGVAMVGVMDELEMSQLPLVFANGLLLWAAFGAFGLAASVSFDRHAPAIGWSLAYLVVNYFLEVLGSLWTDVAWSQQYSLFHHFNAGKILQGEPDPIDFVILAAATLVPLLYGWIVYPRRDLAAPT